MITVGTLLKSARANKGLTLSDIEKKLRVREKYIKALEAENWQIFSSKIYIIGLLKNYSKALELDQRKVLAFFRRDYERREDVRFKKKVNIDYLTPESKKTFRIILVFVFSLIILYFGYQLKMYFTPPKIALINLKKEIFKTEEKVSLVIKTEKDAAIFIFGERVYQDKDGLARYNFPLKEGNNKIIIEVIGANGKKSILEKNFIKRSPR